MAHVRDQWFKTGGDGSRVKTARHGTGHRWMASYEDGHGRRHAKSFDVACSPLADVGGRAFGRIRSSAVQEWLAELTQRLSPGTVRQALIHFSEILNVAVDDELIAKDEERGTRRLSHGPPCRLRRVTQLTRDRRPNDTDAASVLQKGRAPAWVNRHLVGARVWLSFITVGELWKWAEVRDWGEGNRTGLDA